MNILMIGKYPPIQGGVSAECYWLTQILAKQGHSVSMVTNAFEVEEAYRLDMSADDHRLLFGFFDGAPVCFKSTTYDQSHTYIPQGNPVISKLVNIALQESERLHPDIIWATYLEPYGVAGLIVSKLLAVPLVIRHAGSDIGRLMLNEQLRSVYVEVFRNAAMVLTQQRYFEMFQQMGVRTNCLQLGVSPQLRPELFFPKARSIVPKGNDVVVGSYGKVGRAKGTEALIGALALMKHGESYNLVLHTHWCGRSKQEYEKLIEVNGLAERTVAKKPIPHWRIPDFIRSCDVVCFLENDFSIGYHGSFVPLEVVACGTVLVTTEETAKQQFYSSFLRDLPNVVVIQDPVDAESVAEGIRAAVTKLSEKELGDVNIDVNSFSLQSERRVGEIVQRFGTLI